jgi:hypothetical protein
MPTGKVKINGVWYTIGGLSEVDKQTIDQQMSDNLDASKAYADGLEATTSLIISAMRTDLSNAQVSMDNYFADNIVYDSEMTQLNKYLTTLDLDKANLDKRYDIIYNNQYLADSVTDTPKTDLKNAKTDFDAKYTSLIGIINDAVLDTIVDLVEKSRVDNAFVSIQQSLNGLDLDFQTAIDALSDVYVQNANLGTPIPGLIGSLSDTVERHTSTITQTATQISQKVSTETYNNEQTQLVWYNFVKSNNPNIIGDLESLTPPDSYSWILQPLPDGTQGRVLYKKHIGGQLIDNTEWVIPEIKVDPKKPYLIEVWVHYSDTNSAIYFGRDEYTGITDTSGGETNGAITLGVQNDDGSAYLVEDVIATSAQIGTWIKHYAVIPPYDAGSADSHLTVQSGYTPDYDYKFWNENTAFIKPKIYLTYNVTNPSLDSEMYVWGMGLYEIGSKINLYKEIENLNVNMTNQWSEIQQNSNEITLRVTTATYNSDMQNVNDRLNNIGANVPYRVVINSSNGSYFKNGQGDTYLSAQIWFGTVDVTDTTDDSQVTWKRISSDPVADETWNTTHGTTGKTIHVTSTDINRQAVFEVDVTITTP